MQITKFRQARPITMLLTALLMGWLASDLAVAQEQTGDTVASDLPDGSTVMSRYIEASGGEAAFAAIKNRYSESTLEIAGQGIKLEIKTWAAKPNLLYFLMDSEMTGKVEKGCNGEVFWESSLMSGPVVHDGVQHVVGLRDSTFERFIHSQLEDGRES